MAQAFPPRYLPTLTEVVQPGTPGAYSKVLPAAPAERALPAASVGRMAAAAPDRHALAQQLISLIGLLLDLNPAFAALAPPALLLAFTYYMARRAAA